LNGEFTIAVHALVYLYHHPNIIVSSDVLAKNVCTNPARIRKVMGKLKKDHLVATKEGNEGGYFFQQKTDDITMEDILNALCLPVMELKWHSGSHNLNCMISSGMGDVMEGIYQELDTLCHQHLATITLGEIAKQVTTKRKDQPK